jgi:hypothetical protein
VIGKASHPQKTTVFIISQFFRFHSSALWHMSRVL